MTFRKYMHLERFGATEVNGIEVGDCYIFPKIDGTNSSVWLEDGEIQAGSRNRHLSTDKDNAGFCAFVNSDDGFNLLAFLQDNQNLRLYGEWLVPHTLKTYRDDAWRKFYVFDVYDDKSEKYISYTEYYELLGDYGIDCIPPICIVKNPHVEKLINLLDSNSYLIKDGDGFGEGIVIKNYDFVNRYGRTTWAKIVRNEFKEKHARNSEIRISNQTKEIEMSIVNDFVTSSLVEKTYAKIAIDGWQSKMIPRLLNTVFYDLVNEDIWTAVKKYKMPRVDFKRLNTLTIAKIKELKPDLF